MMNSGTSTRSIVILTVLAAILLVGCVERKISVIEGERIIRPTDRVEEYLRLVYNTRKRDEAYELLTLESRKSIPLKDFRALIRAELSDVFATRTSSEIQVRVKHLKDFAIIDGHYIVYSLLQISFPYSDGLSDRFRLTKFHVYRRAGSWYLEPFIHRKTFTKRLVPSLVIGTQRELDEMRKNFYDIIGKDLLKERKRIETLKKSSQAARDGQRTAKTLEKIGTLVIPDLRIEQTGKDNGKIVNADAARPTDTEIKIKANAFITAGRLHFQTGNIPAAEASFLRALELDEFNEIAKNFLRKCTDISELQDEKKKQIERKRTRGKVFR